MKTSIVKNTLIATAVLTSIGTTTSSFAEGNFYVGAAASQSFVDEFYLDEDDTGGKIFGGYKINEYFAIEGGHFNFGDIREGANHLEVDGISLAVVGSVPLTAKLSAFAKVGAHDWDADATGSVVNQLSNDSDTDVFYGAGVRYAFSDNWTILGEVERYEVEDIDFDVASIGVEFNF